MRAFKVLAVVVLGAVALLGAGLFALTRYLDSEAFRRAAIGAAQGALGAPVAVGRMDVSLFSGATLRQVTVGNPPGVPGELLRAEALVVRPRLLPLLRRRLEIAEIRLDAPNVTLLRNERGEWSFERLGVHGRRPRPDREDRRRPRRRPCFRPSPASFDVIVPHLVLSRGTLDVARERKGPLLGAEGIELSTSWSRVGGALSGAGPARDRLAPGRRSGRRAVPRRAAPVRRRAISPSPRFAGSSRTGRSAAT